MSSQPESEKEILAEYRKALHRGENVSVDKLPIYAPGTAQSVAYATVTLSVSPRITQQIVPVSGMFLSGIMPMNRTPWNEAAEDQEQRKERMLNMGNKVLRHVNAHETARLGELSDTVRERLQYLKDTASFTNEQWKAFASLTESLNEMIGDPYDPESVESD